MTALQPIVGLASPRDVCQATINELLVRQGFATISMQQPLHDAAAELYGFSWWDVMHTPDEKLAHLEKTPRELAHDLGEYVRAQFANTLPMRVVQRLLARKEWNTKPVVIREITCASEIEWLRSMGARVWWIRGRQDFAARALSEAFTHLLLCHYQPGDAAILTSTTLGTPAELDLRVALELKALRQSYELPQRPQPTEVQQ
jgi:hypothetical protein